VTREQLNELRSLVCAFAYRAQTTLIQSDATTDEESEALEKEGRAYQWCAGVLAKFVSEQGGE
jgi:hypothetical protein